MVAAATVAFYPALINDSGMLLTESLAGTLVTGALVAMLRIRERSAEESLSGFARALDWAMPGALLGMLAMVRPEYLFISIALIGVFAVINRDRGWARTGHGTVIALTALLVVVAPWTIHNVKDTGRMLPMSTGGGQTLFTGSYLASAGDPLEVMPDVLKNNPVLAQRLKVENAVSGEGPRSITPERVLALLAAAEMPGIPTDIALSRMGRENYLDALRHEPFHLAGYLAGKSARIWWRGRTDVTGTALGRAGHMTLVAGALVGLMLLGFRRSPAFWLILTLTLGATLIGAVFVASPRRTLVFWPVISCLTGLGFSLTFRLARDAVAGRMKPVRIA